MDTVNFVASGTKPLLVIDSWRKLVGYAVLALLLGVLGAFGTRMYFRHNDQHALVEQHIAAQKAFNDQVVAAINQLSARLPKAP